MSTTIDSPSALMAIEEAQINMQVATARRYPRVISKVKQDMLSFACLDEETAASCFYTLPRGGKTIQGESVRLAEIALSCYGNIKAGARPIETVTTGDHPHVVVQAVAIDLEKNTCIAIEKRRRITKKKSKDAIDEDDINLAVNACAAIAFRDAVFKVIPKALLRPVFLEAKRVAVGDVKSLAAKREKVVDRLKQMGALEARIFAAVDARKIDDITLDKLEVLIGLGTALKDGEITLEEAFPAPAPKPESATTAAQQQQQPQGEPAQQAATTTPQAESPQETEKPKTIYEQLESIVAEAGYTFDDWNQWAMATGNIEVPATSYNDMPEAVATKCVKAKTGLLKGLAAGRK